MESTSLPTNESHHAHEAGEASNKLGRIATLRIRTQLKLTEALPVLGPFLETQAACVCKAGCPTCAGPTLGASAWAATKGWFGKRFSRSEKEPQELPHLWEKPAHFVMRSAEATLTLHPEEPVDIAEIVVRNHHEEAS